jgi:hypothetical protein
MKNRSNSPKKRTQRDYTLAFKLAVIDQVEKGKLTYKQYKPVVIQRSSWSEIIGELASLHKA